MKSLAVLLTIIVVQTASAANMFWEYSSCSDVSLDGDPRFGTEQTVELGLQALPYDAGFRVQFKTSLPNKTYSAFVTPLSERAQSSRIWKGTSLQGEAFVQVGNSTKITRVRSNRVEVFYQELENHLAPRLRVVVVEHLPKGEFKASFDVAVYEVRQSLRLALRQMKDGSWKAQVYGSCDRGFGFRRTDSTLIDADPNLIKLVENFVPGFKDFAIGGTVLAPDGRVGRIEAMKEGMATLSFGHFPYRYRYTPELSPIAEAVTDFPILSLSPSVNCTGGRCLEQSLKDYQCDTGRVVGAFANGMVISRYRKHDRSFLMNIRNGVGVSLRFPGRGECQ
jgi:hypothetical protein